MGYDKKKLLALSLEERRELAADLIDSILAEETHLPAWKKAFIDERLALDKANPSGSIEWSELRKKYFTPNQTDTNLTA